MPQLPTTWQPAQLQITPEVIAAYAALTQDFNPIHLDPAFAARTPMGGVIAHGTLSIGLLWQALARSVDAEAFAGATLDIRFVKPVRVGEHLVAGGQLRADEPGLYDCWVRAEADGADRIVGQVRVPIPSSLRAELTPP